jgi:hypothetical protein
VLQRQINQRIPHGGAALLQGRIARGSSQRIAEALSASFGYTFWVLLAITCVGLAGSFFLPRGPARALDPADSGQLDESGFIATVKQ